MKHTEGDLTTKLIIPQLRQRGWTDDLMQQEVIVGRKESPSWIESPSRIDIVLFIRVNPDSEPVPIAAIEVKGRELIPAALDQAKKYATLLNVPFACAMNKDEAVVLNIRSDSNPQIMRLDQFPTPREFREGFENLTGIHLDAPNARPLIAPYAGGRDAARPHQDAAIRAVIEAIASGQRRILVNQATGTGVSFTIVNLIRRLLEGEEISKVLIVTYHRFIIDQFRDMTREFWDIRSVATQDDLLFSNSGVSIVTYRNLLNLSAEDNSILDMFDLIVLANFSEYAGGWQKPQFQRSRAIQVGFVSLLPVGSKASEVLGNPVYSYNPVQAIDDGYLEVRQVSSITGRDKSLTEEIVPTENPPDVVTGKPISDEDLIKPYLIFISYRRDDTQDIARQLFDRLRSIFKIDEVFLDKSSIGYGENFSKRIFEAIDECEIVLVIIGMNWLHITDSKGNRRLNNPKDYVRQEIEYSLKNEKKVIPVLVRRADMPSEDELPDSIIRDIVKLNAFNIVDKDKYFESEVDDLISTIKDLLKTQGRLRL